jgi:hypothetical protein
MSANPRGDLDELLADPEFVAQVIASRLPTARQAPTPRTPSSMRRNRRQESKAPFTPSRAPFPNRGRGPHHGIQQRHSSRLPPTRPGALRDAETTEESVTPEELDAPAEPITQAQLDELDFPVSPEPEQQPVSAPPSDEDSGHEPDDEYSSDDAPPSVPASPSVGASPSASGEEPVGNSLSVEDSVGASPSASGEEPVGNSLSVEDSFDAPPFVDDSFDAPPFVDDSFDAPPFVEDSFDVDEPAAAPPPIDQLRRPMTDNQFWSCTVEKWNNPATTGERKQALSHAGQIMETPLGEVRAQSCSVSVTCQSLMRNQLTVAGAGAVGNAVVSRSWSRLSIAVEGRVGRRCPRRVLGA